MTKEALREYVHLKSERVQLARLLRELEMEMEAPSIQKMTGMPHAPSGNKSSLEAVVARHLDLMERYQNMLGRIDEIQAQIEEAIASLDGVERTLMRYRYLDGMSWNDICEAMNYSWSGIHKIHGGALAKLRKSEWK